MVSPNQLTVLRMAFVPILILMVVYEYLGIAILVFFAAGITDMLDGLIARRMGRKTPLGTYLDPIADKLLLVSSFITLSSTSLDLIVRIPLWLTITVISRDILLVLSVLVFSLAIGRRQFPPSVLGKYTTACQLFYVMVVLVSNFIGKPVPLITIVSYVTLALTVASGLHYMSQGMLLIRSESANEEK